MPMKWNQYLTRKPMGSSWDGTKRKKQNKITPEYEKN